MIAFLSVVVVGCECDDLYALLHFHCTWEMGKRRGRSSGLLRGWRANGGFVWRIPQTGTIESLFSSYFVMDISIGKRLLLQPHKMRARSGTAPQRNTKASPPPRPIRFLLFRLLLSSSPFTFATPGSSHAILPNRKIELEGTKKKKGKKEKEIWQSCEVGTEKWPRIVLFGRVFATLTLLTGPGIFIQTWTGLQSRCVWTIVSKNK